MRTAMRIALAGVVAAAMGTVALGAAPTALGAPAAPTVTRQGACSGPSTWTLTLSYDRGKVESDFEVHTAAAGQTWHATMKDNGTRFYSASKITGSDGDVSFQKHTTDLSGSDHVVAKAKNLTTAEVCKGAATL